MIRFTIKQFLTKESFVLIEELVQHIPRVVDYIVCFKYKRLTLKNLEDLFQLFIKSACSNQNYTIYKSIWQK